MPDICLPKAIRTYCCSWKMISSGGRNVFGVILTYFDGKDTTDSVCIKETITNSFRNRFATLVLKLPLKEPNNVFDLLRFHCFLVWPIYFIQLIAICSPSDFFIFQFYCVDDLFSWWLVTGLWTDWYGYLYDYLG